MFTNVHVNQHVIAVPHDLVEGFVLAVRKGRLARQAEANIRREAEVDELIDLMDGYTV
jgi:hypothetical protein